MFIASLITNPATPVLDRATVESLRNAWGGGDARWLNPGIAAEFGVEAMPENRWDVWQSLQSLRIDMAVQPALGRKKQLLTMPSLHPKEPMNSMLINDDCLDCSKTQS